MDKSAAQIEADRLNAQEEADRLNADEAASGVTLPEQPGLLRRVGEAVWEAGAGLADLPVRAAKTAGKAISGDFEGAATDVARRGVSAFGGFTEMGTAGHRDEIGAAQRLVKDQIAPNPEIEDNDFTRENYYKRKAGVEELFRRAEEAEPGAYTAGQLMALAPGLAVGAGKAALTRLGRLGSAVKTALPQGLAFGAGTSEAEPLKGDVGDYLGDIAIAGGATALTAGGLSGGGELVRPAAARAKELLRDLGVRGAIKATGAIQNNIKGVPAGRLKEMGQQLLEHDVVVPFRGVEGVGKAAGQLKQAQGSLIGDVLDRADVAAAKSGKPFDWSQVLHRLNTEVRAKLGITGQRAAGGAIKAKTGGYAPSFFDDIAQEAANGGGFAAANRAKSEIASDINWSSDSKLRQRVAKQVQGILDDEIEKQLGATAGAQALDEFKAAKSLYGTMKSAQTWSKKGMERQIGNRWASPSDYGAGMTGALAASLMSGGSAVPALATGAGLGLTNNLLRKYGQSVAAPAFYGASRAIKPGALGRATNAATDAASRGLVAPMATRMALGPDEDRAWVEALPGILTEAPEALGKYGPYLAKMLKESGPDALAAVDYALSKESPEYQRIKFDLMRAP